MTHTSPGEPVGNRAVPRFLTDYAPTPERSRITPFSRSPVTGSLGEVLPEDVVDLVTATAGG